MSHTATEFFKELGAEIYYLTGENKIIQVYPKKKQSERNILNQVTLKEYVESYGFSMREGHLSNIPFDFTLAYFKLFLTFGDPERQIINELRKKRKKVAIIDDFSGLRDFLCTIKFPLSDPAFLTVSKKEVKYLTGDWLEEYVYFMIKRDLKIADENIKTGIVLEKKGIPNEFDVVFILNGSLYTIECKTSIVNKSEESINILNETIYKVTALQKNLGLHSKFSIFTLSSKDQEVKDAQLERGKLFNINVFCRQDIVACDDFSRLLR
jgi:hypothetical protein